MVQQLLPLPRLMTRQLLGSAGNPAYLQSPGIARQVAIQPASDVPRVELVGFHSLVALVQFHRGHHQAFHLIVLEPSGQFESEQSRLVTDHHTLGPTLLRHRVFTKLFGATEVRRLLPRSVHLPAVSILVEAHIHSNLDYLCQLRGRLPRRFGFQ